MLTTLTPLRQAMGLTPDIAEAAQKVYDAWEQDAEGYDEYYGSGGICDDVAEAILGVLADQGIAADTSGEEGGHCWVVAKLAEGVYRVDIPACVYEEGDGYCWAKRDDITITADDVTFDRIDRDPERFPMYCDSPELPERA